MIEYEMGRTDQSILAGEAGSVRRWLTRYFGLRVRNHAEIDDMVQDVFARMVARDSTEPIANLGGYVLKTASSVLTDYARSRSSHRAALHVAFDAEVHGEKQSDPERLLCGREDLSAAIACLLCLPERTRTVFLLRRLEGKKYRDIAGHLGISVSAVEKHMLRAVQHLSSEMDKHYGS